MQSGYSPTNATKSGGPKTGFGGPKHHDAFSQASTGPMLLLSTMRDPDRRCASKRAYYERHKLKLQEIAQSRYAAECAASPSQQVSTPKRCRARTGRDTERRKASRQAYYLRNRTALLQKARERMARSRTSKDAAALFARRLAHGTYCFRFHELLNIRRLNMYRKRWILKHGVSEFLKNFRGRAKAEHGQLLEHWDSETITSLIRAQ